MDALLIQKLKENKKIASVRGVNLPISTKHSVNICRYITFLTLDRAKRDLKRVINKELAIPFYKFNRDIPHRKQLHGSKIKHGRYPEKASKYILKLLESLEKNAINMGMNPKKLVIVSATASKGTTVYGRIRMNIVRRKRTHIKIYAMEIDSLDPEKRYSKKALKTMVKQILKEWSQKA